MPTDTDTRTVEVRAPFDQVLATVRDVAGQPEWIPEILEAEVLERKPHSDLPATARFKASAAVGTDEYVLSYKHTDTTMSWRMLEGRLQTGQEGRYVLRRHGPSRTEVTYTLTIHHNLPLPGFLRHRVIRGLVDSTLTGLQKRFEGSGVRRGGSSSRSMPGRARNGPPS
jgi:uncharacterized membrane protein